MESEPIKQDESLQGKFDYQGKRPDQVEASNTIFFWCLVAIVALTLILVVC